MKSSITKASEKLFGIPQQPGPTCYPVDYAHEALNDMQAMHPETAELIGFVRVALEDARSNATRIRAWGQAWKEKAKAAALAKSKPERK